MFSTDLLLSEFIDDWNAGRRPDVREYLRRVPKARPGRGSPKRSRPGSSWRRLRSSTRRRARRSAPSRSYSASSRRSATTPGCGRRSFPSCARARVCRSASSRPGSSSASRWRPTIRGEPPSTWSAWSAGTSSPRACRGGCSTRSPSCSGSVPAPSSTPARSAAACGPPPRGGRCFAPKAKPRTGSATTWRAQPGGDGAGATIAGRGRSALLGGPEG
jgi:hypothetical protein